MLTRLLKISTLLLVPLFIVACGGEEAPESRPAIKKAVKKAEAEQASAEEDASMANQFDQTFFERPSRNPFLTYIVEEEEGGDGRIRGPLECCDLHLFKVLAVMSNIDDPAVLLLSPDGKKYIVKIGDTIGLREGVITEIWESSMVVRELSFDDYGKRVLIDVEVELPRVK